MRITDAEIYGVLIGAFLFYVLLGLLYLTGYIILGIIRWASDIVEYKTNGRNKHRKSVGLPPLTREQLNKY